MKLLSSLLSLATPLQAQVLGAIESFTKEDNADGWGFYNYATGEAFNASWKLPGTTDAEIYATFSQDAGVSLFADTISSGGFFVGDYASAGIDSVSCDIYVEDLPSFDNVEFYILAGDTFYYSDYFEVLNSGWSSLLNSFSKDQWYIYDEDDEEFVPAEVTASVLSDIVEIGVNFYPSSNSADGKTIALDNFALLPDLSPPAIDISADGSNAAVSFTGIEGIEYIIESSSTLLDLSWSQIGAPIEIIGPSETVIPLSTKSFFRILTQPFYIEVP